MRPYIAIILASLFTGCSEDEKKEETSVETNIRGEWTSDRKYSNDFFEIVAEIPVEWHLDKGSNEYINDSATEFLGGDDENLKATLKTAIEKTHTVFWAYRYPLGTPGKPNPNITMLIENVEHLPGLKSAADYLLVMEDTLKMSNKNISFVTKPNKVDVGGVEFWMRETKMPMGTIEVRQKFYCRMKDRYVLMFGVTTMSEEDEKTVSEITRTIGSSKGM